MARENYARIETAATSRPSWIYAVLTFDPAAHRDRWAAFRAAGELWDNRLRERLQRAYGRLEYVQTWEQHRSGWPHVNLLMRSDALLEHVGELGVEVRRAKGTHGERDALFPHWRTRVLGELAPACGFGMRVWAELIEPRSSAGMAAYLAKHTLAGELTRAHLKGGDQRCTEAPRGFRALRASHRLLPPRRAAESEWTGFLVKKPLELLERELVDEVTGELRVTTADVERLWLERADLAARVWYERWGAGGPPLET